MAAMAEFGHRCRRCDALYTTAAEKIGPLSPEKMSELQQRVRHACHSSPIPDHPPYAWMIQRAITESNEASGMTEEQISMYIVSEYEGLPWAHSSFLSHHLRKLCCSGDILHTSEGRYTIPDSSVIDEHLGRPGKEGRFLPVGKENSDTEDTNTGMRELRTRKNEKAIQIFTIPKGEEAGARLASTISKGDMGSTPGIGRNKKNRKSDLVQKTGVNFKCGSSCWEYIGKPCQQSDKPGSEARRSRVSKDMAILEQKRQSKRKCRPVSGLYRNDAGLTGARNSLLLDTSVISRCRKDRGTPATTDRRLVCGLRAQGSPPFKTLRECNSQIHKSLLDDTLQNTGGMISPYNGLNPAGKSENVTSCDVNGPSEKDNKYGDPDNMDPVAKDRKRQIQTSINDGCPGNHNSPSKVDERTCVEQICGSAKLSSKKAVGRARPNPRRAIKKDHQKPMEAYKRKKLGNL